jgi:NADPH:quinone reductase-like Zn-dependent oxidoreductase
MSNSGSSNITMRAWTINGYGESMQMTELPLPRPGPGDVLIRMHGAEVGDWDELVRTGEWPMERAFPLVLGLAGAGTVTSVGKDVTRFKEHDPVYAYSYPLYDNGAWAEYMLVPESYAARPPPALELTRAGAVPVAGLTVHETLLDILDVRKNEVVLITAASGGVGHLAVQLARHLGAHVVATTSSVNADFVQELGAETVIDYTSRDVVQSINALYPKGVHKALNGVRGVAANQYVSVLAGGGHMVDLPGSITARRPDVRIDTDYVVRGDGARLQLVSDLIDAGTLRVEVIEEIPFERAPDALEKVLSKHVVGKIALKIR